MIPLEKYRRRAELETRMASSSLPVLPPATAELLDVMYKEGVSFDEVTAVVEKFPPVAARLIALANSSWSSPAVEVTSLDMACRRLGLLVVRSVSVALSIANVFNPRTCPAFDPLRFWNRAFLMAELSTLVVWRLPPAHALEPQTARTAGLLHNLGLLWLATWMPEETNKALSAAGKQEEKSTDQLLEAECGIGYIEASALLAQAWKFPRVLVTALLHHQNPDYQGQHWIAAAVVGVAGLLEKEEEDEEAQPDLDDPRLAALALSPQDLTALKSDLPAKREQVRRLAETLFR